MRRVSIAAFVLTLAACGGSGGDEAVDPTTTTVEATTTTTEASYAAAIRPFWNSETGADLAGDCFDAELVSNLMDDENAALAEFVAVDWRVLPASVTDDVASNMRPNLYLLLDACEAVMV